MSDHSPKTSGLTSPPIHAFTITPDDAQDLPRPIRGLMVRAGGDVALVTLGGDTITLPGLLPGAQYAIRANRILAAGTTASGLVGLA